MFLAAVKRTAGNPWICHSCHNARRFQSSLGLPQRLFPQKTLDLTNKAVEALRAEGPARTRFAPSPTGYLHLGSLRTALFNYLVAKATGGQFLLRIEDTDQKRTVPDAEQRLYEDLEWAGIEWDEGPKVGGPYGPYKQSERKALYRKHAEKLVESGHAYRCFCSPTRLKRLAEVKHHDGTSIGYDRKCLKEYTAEQSAEMAANNCRHIIRLKVPKRLPAVDDLVYGKSPKKRSVPFTVDVHNSFDDMVLMKTDRFPTYHLANVVDDHLMKITHVIRGAEWFSSTPKHVLIYEAFGWTPPKFAHVGLLLDEKRAKLSKRNQDIDISSFRKQGVFPETLTNFVALLGWSHNQPKDMMSMEELIKNASMKYTRGDTVVSFEKMWFLQKAHAARYASLPPSTNPSHSLFKLAVEPIMENLSQLPIEEKAFFAEIPEGFDQEAYITKILLASAAKYTTPIDFVARNKFFFTEPTRSDLRATVPLLRLGNKNFMIGETIERSNQLGVERDSNLNLPPPIPIIDPSTFLSFINQFQEIREHDWTTTSLKSWIASVSLQASHTKTLEVWRITDPAKRTKVEEKLRKAWGTLVHEYLRWALLASMNGPESAETMIILGRNETLQRLRDAAEIMVQWEQTWEGREQVEMFEAVKERKEWERRERNRDTKRRRMMKWSGILPDAVN